MNRNLFRVHFIITLALIILQTTLFRHFQVKSVAPDLLLIFMIFSAHTRGAFQGQILGFSCGIVEDLLSLSPLGFNGLIRLILSYLFGLTKGKIFLDPLVIPILFIILGTALKELLAFFISLVFLEEKLPVFDLFFLIELGINTILAPVVYNILKKARVFTEYNKDRR